ncbi:Mesencephalic astrocyte-derived neurotrophic factor protein [Paragonimus heterotremus]|uniref:Mesencephalic astrocyte-derived neurotrophic factor homolog n=1 Tax=Paragonimus heterotremus TaxID=100268 RepID=A0A8J4STD5_9TREM|nr:Mesencephalic astrocyte-derived neurotrophic factor protein [Paragonimus heterotremus]
MSNRDVTRLALFSFVISVSLLHCATKKVDESNCEVCVKFLRKLYSTFETDNVDRGSLNDVKDAIVKLCKTADHVENRFCYHIGAVEESAAKTVGTVALHINLFKPPEKVCEEVSKIASDICSLKYRESILDFYFSYHLAKKKDLTQFDFTKARLKELKEILYEWGIYDCPGCIEKSDYLQLVLEKLPIYAPEAAAALEQRKKHEL